MIIKFNHNFVFSKPIYLFLFVQKCVFCTAVLEQCKTVKSSIELNIKTKTLLPGHS